MGYNIGQGIQDLELHSLGLSDEVPAIYCQFFLEGDEEQVDESAVLQCNQCWGLVQLSYVKEWLEERDRGSYVSYCIWLVLISFPVDLSAYTM